MRLVIIAALLVACSANDDVPAPSVASVVPDHAPAGTVVLVAGAYFCQRPETGNEDPTCATSGTVRFGADPATATTWTDTSIMVEVPQGVTGSVDVSLTAAGKTSNSVAFTVE